MMHNIMKKYQVLNLMWNFFTYFILLDIVSADKTLFNNWETTKERWSGFEYMFYCQPLMSWLLLSINLMYKSYIS